MNEEPIGPLQLLVVAFADPRLDGSILEELVAASASGAVRVVDVLGVYKEPDGNVVAAQGSDLTEDEAISYGAWVGALIGLGMGGEQAAETGALVGGMAAADEYEYGLDADALATIADDIPKGGAAMLLIVEHRWAIGLRDAILRSGGILVTQDFLNPEALVALGAEVALHD
jgi:uncharacterized membrane protein